MIKFKRISLRNFMSYGNAMTVIELDRPGPTLVIGEDLDNTAAGEGGNGVGKTTLMNALVYCLYDKPISDIKVDDLINNINKKSLEVQVEFEKGGNEYVVNRYRKTGKGNRDNGCRLLVNSRDETRDSTNNTTKAIEQILGMSYDMFVRIVVVSATHQPFLDLPVRGVNAYQPNQSDFIERLFDLTILSEKALLLKDMMKSVEESVKVQKVKLQQLEAEHMRHYQAVEDAKKRVVEWEKNKNKEITAIAKQLERDTKADLVAKQKELERVDSEMASISKQIAEKAVTVDGLSKLIEQLETESTKCEKDLKSLKNGVCPYCKQGYPHDHVKDKIVEVETQLTGVNQKLTAQEILHRKEDGDFQRLNTDRRHLERSKKSVDSEIRDLYDIEAQSVSMQQKLKDLENSPNPLLMVLEDLEKIQIPSINYDSINEHTKTISHQEFLLKLLTKKDSFVRKALLNKNIPFLNLRLNHYLAQLGLPHKVEFTHEMTAEISQFGRPMGFGNLSNGQRARVNLALSFAFRDVLQRLHTPVNICMLDEVLDVGLDDIGVSAAARMLKRKARDEQLCMFIISHRNELDNAFDRTLIIQMYKGFSHLKQVTNV